jgi:hypothetical protein
MWQLCGFSRLSFRKRKKDNSMSLLGQVLCYFLNILGLSLLCTCHFNFVTSLLWRSLAPNGKIHHQPIPFRHKPSKISGPPRENGGRSGWWRRWWKNPCVVLVCFFYLPSVGVMHQLRDGFNKVFHMRFLLEIPSSKSWHYSYIASSHQWQFVEIGKKLAKHDIKKQKKNKR